MYYVGGTQQFTHVEQDSDGNILASQPGKWASTNEAVATIDQTGLATWRGAGATELTYVIADYRRAAILHVVVHAAIPATLIASPPTVTLNEGSIAKVTLTATDIDGNPTTDFEIDNVVSSDPTAAEALIIGPQEYLVLGKLPGGCQITVFSGAISAAFNVDVLALITQPEADARYRQLSVIVPASDVAKDIPIEHGDQAGSLAIAWTRAARAHHVRMIGDLAITLSDLLPHEFAFIDVDQDGFGAHAFSLALDPALPELSWDGMITPSESPEPDTRDSYLIHNQGDRTAVIRTWTKLSTA